MNELISAAHQALVALESYSKSPYIRHQHPKRFASGVEAITALRAALAEPMQENIMGNSQDSNEPVAWLWQHRETGRTRVLMPDERTATDVAAAWDVVGPLYLAPPQRPPLTEEEIGIICASLGFAQISPVEVARAIERAHGIKEQP